MNYEAVIGLEVHVQVKTASKMFTRVAAGYGHAPNTLTDPVVLALPGTLPVMNKAALDAIIKAGLLLGCEIAPVCKWDRKNYFYPDSPKNYQISQYDQPICLGGAVEIELPGSARNVMGEHKKIPLTRIHLEEDVGKLNHESVDSLVDYNRAGTPLMEIVSEPAIHSAEEAFAYLTSLRATMIYGGISDCDMEKGQLRCDANISVRPVGETKLGTKVELKNLNSISFVRDGIAHEIKRQLAVIERGGTIVQETRDYDGQTGTSQSLRSKEMAHDYRYFPDPDLMPVVVDQAWKARIQTTCPELPFDKQRRFFEQYRLPYTLTSVLVWDRELSDYFEETVKIAGADKAQTVGNWIVNDLLREIGTARVPLADAKVRPAHIAELVKLIDAGTILTNAAKEIFVEMFATGDTPAIIADRRGLKAAPTDSNELEQWCRDAIAANAKAVAEFKAGKDSAINAFKGPVMKAAKGKANPKLVDETLRRLLAAL
ncbi:Asp-tRNA(Asn)/Glu-tRNA(Gln) amidotransferase subunit GatB [Opitutus terrae]|uniref:Aspartyl/glutamyl-tRNA(Asn/Gln) amidotransferase subunit B n=1 Tax=Opitutus terrae (strain DSM 11246 / JCM 15787 / PB90-1) TaxID=452637 RepID=GATB_OPITP|nr:Asp-tRNA(Asn)/Glu-tRNA(Gln) amidotransferase subunit GatB [Opitutus terrae]B1ZQN4.1 RecName: Full=Aspartyl/glutamyl-tRNA(Asn/Gln) amidotransferase subunit B; Short=Asp/Glu-ADT subunit B [Opitutus terrae PB90-1]ACB75643.1 glutamyl-tRNA(Gln) amidotransferase, B subunit [Opitutus terrae PB90-1]